MPRLPDYSKLGSPSFGSGTPLATVPQAPSFDGAAEGLASLGKSVQRVGIRMSADAKAEEKKQKTRGTTLDLLTAKTDLNEKYIPFFASLKEDADYASLGDKFDAGTGPMVMESAQLIGDPDKRAKWILQQRMRLQSGKAQILNYGLVREKQAHFVTVKNAMESEAKIFASPASSPEDSEGAEKNLVADLEAAKRSGLIDPFKADLLNTIIDQAYEAKGEMVLLTPDGAKKIIAQLTGPLKDNPYRRMSQARQDALRHKAGVRITHVTQKDVGDMAARLEDGVEPLVDPTTGLNAWQRAQTSGLKGNQLDQLKSKLDESVHKAKVILPLKNMSDTEQDAHLVESAPETTDKNYNMKASVLKDGHTDKDKIRKLRKDDPALSVKLSPEVVAAEARIEALSAEEALEPEEGGPIFSHIELSDQEKLQILLKARLDAQTSLGLHDKKLITEAEAQVVLNMGDPTKMTTDAYLDKLIEASNRAEELYGAEYAKRVLKDALDFQTRGEDQKNVAISVLADMAQGKPVDLAAMKQAVELNEIDRIGRVFDEPPTELVSPRDLYEPAPQLEGIAAPVLPSPNQGQIDWLMEDPKARRSDYDDKFGPGAAAKAIDEANKNASSDATRDAR